MHLKILSTLLLLAPFLHAQNYVVNGSFERQPPRKAGLWQKPPQPCQFSGSPDILNTSAEGWRTYEIQTPDLLVIDSSAACQIFPKPRRGNRMVGLIMYHPFQDGQFSFDYHELIQGTFARPLEKGKTYRVSCWVNTNDSLGTQHLASVYGRSTNIHPVFCGNFGFYFSEAKIQEEENFMQSIIDFPMIPQVNYPKIVNTNGTWQKISLQFKTDQPYKYFLFGNFYSDAITPINMDAETRMQLDEKNKDLQFWAKTKRIAYYLFDDFAVVEDNETNIENALLREKRYTFESALLFETGKSDLKLRATAAIQGLATTLLKNSNLKIEIGGHTDNVGEEQANQSLSEARALAVYEALITHQVPPEQITWKGYGESTPIASNNTAAGRRKNRRVECNAN